MNDIRPESPPTSPDDAAQGAAPLLKRETFMTVHDRGRLGLVVALCSLAGVAVGFGLSSMAAGMYSHCGHRCSVHTSAPAAAYAPRAETLPWLGVRIADHDDGGAYVLAVDRSSPAQRIGIRRGDVIVGFTASNCPKRMSNVRTATDLVGLVRSSEIGARALVMIERDDRTLSLRTRLGEMPQSVYYREILDQRR